MGNTERAAALTDFRKYRHKQIIEARPYLLGEDLSGIFVANVYKLAGCPHEGDMIFRGQGDHGSLWLVSANDFHDSYEPA